jgi:arylsulfatase A-like enzyme
MNWKKLKPGNALGLCLTAGALATAAVAPLPDEKPNLVVILIDDMGYSDIEPFGSTLNKTPELSRMATEGMMLTSCYAAAVCTPSRAALMTGCYAKRVGLAFGTVGCVLFPGDANGLNPDEKTLAEVLKDAGYATGCFGKWHLGDQPEFLPTRHGFDTWVGIPYSNDMWPNQKVLKGWQEAKGSDVYPPLPLMRNEDVAGTVAEPSDQAQLCKQFTDAAVEFIRQNKDRPFFAYLPHAFVHNPHFAREEFMERAGPGENRVSQALRAQIEEIDWSVGAVLETLRELNLDQKTMVVFASDNGGMRHCSNAPLRGYKGSSWEGGLRVPAIAWWPGTVPAGTASDEVVATMDLLPTFAALAGEPVPADRNLDGKNILPILRGEPGAVSPHDAFFYFHGTRLDAVRSGKWKLFNNGQLYNLDEDIGEQRDVAAQYPEVAGNLKQMMRQGVVDLGSEGRAGTSCRPAGRMDPPGFLVPLQ